MRIADIQFDRVSINEVLGMRDALPNAIKTFITLDFFNHDTRHTDMFTGYDPQYKTLFSFKNSVDDFYLKHLFKEYVLAEIFTIKGSRTRVTEKIGEAKLPLQILLHGDTSDQAAQILHTQADGRTSYLGKLFYRARMRKPIQEAMKWLNMKQDVTDKQGQDLKKINDQLGISLGQSKNSALKKVF